MGRFSRFACILVSLLTMSVPVGAGVAQAADGEPEGAMFGNGPQRQGVFNSTAKGELVGLKWRFETKGRVYSSPVVLGGKCIVGSADGCVYAIDTRTGQEAWRYKTDGPVHSSPAIMGNSVYVVSMDGKLHAVDFNTGKPLWSFATGGEKPYDAWDPFLSSPNVDGGIVYFGSGDNSFYAVDAATGAKVWQYKTGGMVHTTPAVDANNVYFGNCEGKAYALDKKTGALKWEYKTTGYSDVPKGEVMGTASVYDGIVYIGARDHAIYALEAETGKRVWRMQVYPGWVISAPAIADGKVIYGRTGDYRVYAKDAKTGKGGWSFRTGYFIYGSPSVAGDTVYIGSFNGYLYALDLKTGKAKWSYQTKGCLERGPEFLLRNGEFDSRVYERMNQKPQGMSDHEFLTQMGSIFSSPWIDGDTVYFGSADNGVYALSIK